MTGPAAMLSTAAVALLLGIAEQTLRKWRTRGQGPRHHKLGPRRVRYAERDVALWIAEHRPGGAMKKKSAVSKKISKLVHREKMPVKQAVATALSMQRAGKLTKAGGYKRAKGKKK